MTTTLMAWVFAVAALTSQWPEGLPDATAWGEPANTPAFIGIRWICEGEPGHGVLTPSGLDAENERRQSAGQPMLQSELCFAGISLGPEPEYTVGP